MGSVIPFENGKKREEGGFNPNKEKSKMAAEKTATECPAVMNPPRECRRTNANYAEMEPEQQAEFWKNMEKEEEEKFRIKYKNVLSAVPVSPGAKMQYFANIMLQLLPDVFHNNIWDIRFDTWIDFCKFYMSEFDPAYSDYFKINKKFEQPYSHKFKPISEGKLEEDLKDCLKRIIALYPEKTYVDKTIIMYQAERLFELQDSVTDLFIMEVTND